jgi:hypothetical protein
MVTPNSPIYPNIQAPATTSIQNVPQPVAPAEGASSFDAAFANAQNVNIPSLKYTNPALQTPLDLSLKYADPVYGYSALNPNTEAQYADRQNGFGAFGNNLLKFGANTLGTIGATFAAIPSAISAIADGKLSDIYNNPMVNSINEWTEGLENSLPNYATQYEQDHPLLSAISIWHPKAFTNTWGSVIKNLGFVAGDIASAAIVDAGVGLVTEGTGEIPLLAGQGEKIASDLGKFSKIFSSSTNTIDSFNDALHAGEDIQSAVSKLSSAAKVQNGIKYGLKLFASTVGQASLIANNTYSSSKQQLESEYVNKYGILPTGDQAKTIEQLAVGAGNTNLIANAAIMSLGHAYSLKSFFSPTAQALREGAEQEIASGIKLKVNPLNIDEIQNVTPVTKGWKGVVENSIPFLKNVGVQGLQGGSLYFTDNAIKSYIQRKYDNENVDSFDNLWHSLGDGFSNTFLTKEGQQSIEMGALTGALIHAGSSIFEKIKEAPNKATTTNLLLSRLNDQTVTGLFSHTYDEGINATTISRDMVEAAKNNDPFKYKNLQLQGLFNFVNGATKSGRFDLRIEQLKALKDLNQQQFETLFQLKYTDENRRASSDYVDSLISKALDIKKTINQVNDAFVNKYNPKKDLDNYTKYDNYKDALALTLSHISDTKNRITELGNDVSKIFPTIDTGKIMNLTTTEGIQQTIKDFQLRIKELNTNKELLEGTDANDLKDQHNREISFLEDKIKFLNKHKDYVESKINNPEKNDTQEQTSHADTFIGEAGEILHYYKNNDLKEEPVNFLSTIQALNKSGDIYRLGQFSKSATDYYNVLSTKKGYDKFADFVDDLIKKNDSRIEIDADGKFKYITPEIIKQREDAKKVETKQQIEEALNLETPPEPTSQEEKQKIETIIEKEKNKQPLTDEEKSLKEEKKQTYKNKKKAVEKAEEDYDALTFEDQMKVDEAKKLEEKKAEIQTDKEKELSKVGKKGETLTGFKNGKEVTITQGDVTGDNVNATITNKDGSGSQSGNFKVDDLKKLVEDGFDKKVESLINPIQLQFIVPQPKAATPDNEKKYGNITPNIFHGIDYTGIDENGSTHKTNLFQRLFKKLFPEKIAGEISLKIQKSTKGLEAGKFSDTPIGNSKLYRSGYDNEIVVVADGKELGRISDNLFFDRDGKKVSILDLKQSEYKDVTGNDESTYDSFMKEAQDHQRLLDKIKEITQDGKTDISNKQLSELIGKVSINYGSLSKVNTPEEATLLKDANYKAKDSYVLSLPMVKDPVTGRYTRQLKNVIGEKGIINDLPEDVKKFFNDNIDQILDLDRRYIVLYRMPDGTFNKSSVVAARPSTRTVENLDNLFKEIHTGTKEDVQKELDNIYISAPNKKSFGVKIQLNQNPTDGYSLDFQKTINNNKKSERKISVKIPISKEEMVKIKNIDGLAQFLTKKVLEERVNNKDFKSLNIEKIDSSDFKSNILKDENTNYNELKNKLTIATTSDVYTGYSLQLKPKEDPNAPKPEVKQVPAEQPTIEDNKQALLDSGKSEEEIDKLSPTEVKQQAAKLPPDLTNKPLSKDKILTVLKREYKKFYGIEMNPVQIEKFERKLVQFTGTGHLDPSYVQSIFSHEDTSVGKGSYKKVYITTDSGKELSANIGKIKGDPEFYKLKEGSGATAKPIPINELKTNFDILQQIENAQAKIDRTDDPIKVQEGDKRIAELENKLNKDSEEYKRAKNIFDNFDSITRELEKDGNLKIECV